MNIHVAAQTDTTHELRYPGLIILVYAPELEPEPSMRIRRVQWLFQVD